MGGGLPLTLGLQWLRQAILRASGLMAKHHEDAVYRREVARGDTPELALGTAVLAIVAVGADRWHSGIGPAR